VRAIPAAIGVSLSTGAQSAKAQSVQGVINGRSGATMTLQTADAPRLSVLLTPATEVDQVEGVLKARKKQMTSLILGLPVRVPGSMNDQGQLVATSVKFKGDDLKAAMDAQAGLRQTIAARSVPAGESAQKRHRDFEACSVFVLGRGE
jgi:OOP family OmpA-OmpF porin